MAERIYQNGVLVAQTTADAPIPVYATGVYVARTRTSTMLSVYAAGVYIARERVDAAPQPRAHTYLVL